MTVVLIIKGNQDTEIPPEGRQSSQGERPGQTPPSQPPEGINTPQHTQISSLPDGDITHFCIQVTQFVVIC